MLENKNVWFGSTESDDIEISNKFEKELKLNYDEKYLIENQEHGIGWIILHDQIARHIKIKEQEIIQINLFKIIWKKY